MALDFAKQMSEQDLASGPLAGPHWRPTVRSMLADSTTHQIAAHTKRPTPGTTLSHYQNLPKELRDKIEEHLTDDIDLVCLARTCRRLRFECLSQNGITALSSVQTHQLRLRLDRGFAPSLWAQESYRGKLSTLYATCSYCNILHPRGDFSPDQLALRPSMRRCIASLRTHLICGNYWALPDELREILTRLILLQETSDGKKCSIHTVARKYVGIRRLEPDVIVPIRSLVESIPGPPDRAKFVLTNSGLTFTHHIHQRAASRSNSRGLAHLDSPGSKICPHMSGGQAFKLLRTLDRNFATGGTFLAGCEKGNCRTKFGWSNCSNSFVQSPMRLRYLCIDIERTIGWVETLGDGLWKGPAVNQHRTVGQESSRRILTPSERRSFNRQMVEQIRASARS